MKLKIVPDVSMSQFYSGEESLPGRLLLSEETREDEGCEEKWDRERTEGRKEGSKQGPKEGNEETRREDGEEKNK